MKLFFYVPIWNFSLMMVPKNVETIKKNLLNSSFATLKFIFKWFFGKTQKPPSANF
jgi:hypothetical protein